MEERRQLNFTSSGKEEARRSKFSRVLENDCGNETGSVNEDGNDVEQTGYAGNKKQSANDDVVGGKNDACGYDCGHDENRNVKRSDVSLNGHGADPCQHGGSWRNGGYGNFWMSTVRCAVGEATARMTETFHHEEQTLLKYWRHAQAWRRGQRRWPAMAHAGVNQEPRQAGWDPETPPGWGLHLNYTLSPS
nr:hypothetical protein BaRGS_009390 [Batillaria attramentaria]KAG5706432.1 hypothetical protein BaRGS_032825 [Batillaria attramentaria]